MLNRRGIGVDSTTSGGGDSETILVRASRHDGRDDITGSISRVRAGRIEGDTR